MRKRLITLLTLSMALSYAAAGCRSADTTRTWVRSARTHAQPAATGQTTDTEDAAKRSARLAQHLSGLAGVEKASAVITGDTAVVSISLTGTLADFSDRELMRLKALVEKAAHAFDPALDDVAVTASGELVEQVNDMADAVAPEDTPPVVSPQTERVLDALTPPV